VEKLSSATSYTVLPVAFIFGSVRPDLDSISMSDSLIFDLSLEDGSVLENNLFFEFKTWFIDQKL
jgi:hypothetical protein